jgi:hypothetical protein
MRCYAASELTGLTFSESPIELNGGSSEYFLAFPACTYTHLDEAASGAVVEKVVGCNKCRVLATRKVDRIVIKEETWEGQDVFLFGGIGGVILVTQRFVDFVHDNGFTNFQFIDQDDYHFDNTLGKTYRYVCGRDTDKKKQ